MMFAFAALMIAQAPAAATPQEEAAARFIAACIDGEVRSSDLEPLSAAQAPRFLVRRFREATQVRYFRFTGRPAYLASARDNRSAARIRETCVFAVRGQEPVTLLDEVAARLGQTPIGEGRLRSNEQHVGSTYVNHGAGFSINAMRLEGHAVLQAAHFNPQSR